MPITLEGDFNKILKDAMIKTNAGKILFYGPENEKVSLYFINGKVIQAVSDTGKGKSELVKVSQWKSGKCTIAEMSSDERKSFEKNRLQKASPAPPTAEAPTLPFEKAYEVKLIIRGQNAKFLDLDNILSEINRARYSGEARITSPNATEQILFYQGAPFLSSTHKNIDYSETLQLMNAPGATIDFFNLGEPLSQAFVSVLDGEIMTNGPAHVIDINKILNKATQGRETGHICISHHKEQAHHIFFHQGKLIGAYAIFPAWERVNNPFKMAKTSELSYVRAKAITSYQNKACGPLVSAKDLQEFMRLWNNLLNELNKKVGKKPVEKSIQRFFGKEKLFVIEGDNMQLPQGDHLSVQKVCHDLQTHCPEFLKEMNNIIGGRWLNEQLQNIGKGHKQTLARLSMDKIFLI